MDRHCLMCPYKRILSRPKTYETPCKDLLTLECRNAHLRIFEKLIIYKNSLRSHMMENLNLQIQTAYKQFDFQQKRGMRHSRSR